MNKQGKATGKASIDRPWMKYYPESLQQLQIPHCSLTDYLRQNNADTSIPVIHYYGRELTWNDLFRQADAAAKALCALGFKEGDRIPTFLQAVPEHVVLLLAAEKIGAALICRDGTLEESVVAIQNSKSPVLFAHTYLSKAEEDRFRAETQLERIVTLSPYASADRSKMPEHITAYIDSLQPAEPACAPENLTWDQFLALGEGYTGPWEAPADPDRPLFCAYTSGSTGPSKQVIHSAASMLGVIHQMTPFTASLDFRLTWLHTILPPSLVAVTVTMILSPISSGNLLILDPFCDVQDLDLELMRYRPNCWALIPEFIEVLMRSPRIPADYSMDYLYAAGVGAEPLNIKQIERAEAFLKAHHCPAHFSVSYGMSEGGSGFTLPCPTQPLTDCCGGMPMIATTLAAFAKGTQQELGYGEVGELCKTGPGLMLGYDDPESTAQALQWHPDGQLWLHTGDYGYMAENGTVHVLSRGFPERFGGGRLFVMEMENRIAFTPGMDDGFFVIAPDPEHEGYFLPYLYLVLEQGADQAEVEQAIRSALEPHQQPVEVTLIKERSYFHFKTNRRELAAEIAARVPLTV